MATIKSEYYRLNGITWDKHYFKTSIDMVEGLSDTIEGLSTKYVKTSGTQEISTNLTIKSSDLTLDGGSVSYQRPATTGGWARGFWWTKRPTDTGGATRIGGIGVLGSNQAASKFYIGFGESPWSTSVLDVFPDYVNAVGSLRKSGKEVSTEEWVKANTRSSGWTPSETDIPTLPISKIKGLMDQIDLKVSWDSFVGETDAIWSTVENKVNKVAGKGLSDNNYTTADKNKLASAVTTTTMNTELAKKLNVKPDGTNDLIVGNKVNPLYMDSLFITDVFEVETVAKMLALTGANKGDIAIVSSEGSSYFLKTLPANNINNWAKLLVQPSVVSVAGKTGVVLLGISDISGLTAALNDKTSNSDLIDMYDQINVSLGYKVDKVSGKGLSTNDYTTAEKNKVAKISLTNAATTYLNGAGNYTTPPNTTYNLVTTAANGLMSAADKVKLNGIGAGANVKSVSGKTGAVVLGINDISGLQAALNAKLAVSGGEMSGAINLAGNELMNAVYIWGADGQSLSFSSSNGEGIVSLSNGYSSSIELKNNLLSLGNRRITNLSDGVGTKDAINKSQLTWANVSGKPTWIGSSKPTYTASEVGARPAGNVPWTEVSGKPSFAPSNAQKNSDITKAEIEAKLTGSITSHTHSEYISRYSSVNGLNMNNVTETGFYYGYNMTNAAVTSISTFMVINYSPDWIIQKQFIPASGGNREFIRSRHSGTTWSAWTEIASQSWVTSNTRSSGWTPSETDIPTLPISKISRLQNELNNKVSDTDFIDFTDRIDYELTEKATITSVNNLASLKSNTDNRSTNTSPNLYNSKFMIAGLKTNSVIGISSSEEGTYSSVLGIRGWSDASGGRAHEIAFGGNGNVYQRSGATTTWDSWNKIWTSGNLKFWLSASGDLHIKTL